MNDKLYNGGDHHAQTILDCLLTKLEPQNIEEINEELEGAILSLIT